MREKRFMVASHDVDEIASEGLTPESLTARSRLFLYLLLPIVSPLLLLAAALLILPSQWFALRSQNAYLINLAYGATLHGEDCQILIYGDSSAMVGIDPSIIRARVGLSACNIAEFQPMTALNGTAVLDTYLAHNKPPRFLVFLFAPENLDPQSQHHNGPFEAIVYRMRQPNRLASVLFFASHYPEQLAGWVESGLRFTLIHLFSKPASIEIQQLRARTHGQLPIGAPTLTACDDLHRDAPPDELWVTGLRSRYGRTGTTVLVDATPVPNCDPSLSFFRQHSSGVVDNRIETLPVSAYTVDGRLHVNAKGSSLLTNILVNQLADQMHLALSAGGH
jgi:hypothetical protein